MKKIILAVAAIFLTTGAFAQHFEYGAKTGLNLATLTKMDDFNFRPGVYAGAFVEFVINDRIGVQAEFVYSMQGARNSNMSAPMEATFAVDNDATLTYKLDYLTLPLLAKIYVFKGLSVDLGPQFGYMISAKQTDEIGNYSYTYNFYDENETLKKFDVSAAMGLSYKLPFGLDISARYNLGLTKIGEDDDFKNSVIQFGVGYRF